MNYRNATFNAAGTIDCEIEHITFGWIPFTAQPFDTEQSGKDLHAQITADGGVGAYIAPIRSNAERITQIKEKAGELIISAYPAWKQRNMIARSSYLMRKPSKTAEELTELDALEAIWEWVYIIRSESDTAELDTNLYVEDIVWTVNTN